MPVKISQKMAGTYNCKQRTNNPSKSSRSLNTYTSNIYMSKYQNVFLIYRGWKSSFTNANKNYAINFSEISI